MSGENHVSHSVVQIDTRGLGWGQGLALRTGRTTGTERREVDVSSSLSHGNRVCTAGTVTFSGFRKAMYVPDRLLPVVKLGRVWLIPPTGCLTPLPRGGLHSACNILWYCMRREKVYLRLESPSPVDVLRAVARVFIWYVCIKMLVWLKLGGHRLALRRIAIHQAVVPTIDEADKEELGIESIDTTPFAMFGVFDGHGGAACAEVSFVRMLLLGWVLRPLAKARPRCSTMLAVGVGAPFSLAQVSHISMRRARAPCWSQTHAFDRTPRAVGCATMLVFRVSCSCLRYPLHSALSRRRGPAVGWQRRCVLCQHTLAGFCRSRALSAHQKPNEYACSPVHPPCCASCPPCAPRACSRSLADSSSSRACRRCWPTVPCCTTRT